MPVQDTDKFIVEQQNGNFRHVQFGEIKPGTLLYKALLIPAGSSDTINVPVEKLVSYVTDTSTPVGVPITPVGVYDPTGVSSGEAKLINGNLGDLCYNDLSAGTINKELPAIDLGVAQQIKNVLLWFYPSVAYLPVTYNLQASVDGLNWVNLNTQPLLGSAVTPGVVVTTAVTGAYRYVRVFCVQGTHASWCIISELQVTSTTTTLVKFNDPDVAIVKHSTSAVSVTNSSSVDKIVTLSYLG